MCRLPVLAIPPRGAGSPPTNETSHDAATPCLTTTCGPRSARADGASSPGGSQPSGAAAEPAVGGPFDPANCGIKFALLHEARRNAESRPAESSPTPPSRRHPTPFAIGGRLAPPAQGNRRAVGGLSACSGTVGPGSTLWQGRRSWQLGSRGIIFVPFIPLFTAGVARRASPSPPESPWRRRPWGPCSPSASRPRWRKRPPPSRRRPRTHLFGPAPAPSEGSRITWIGIGKALGQSAADFESS